MQRLELTVSDELANALRPYRDRLDRILRLGLQQLEANEERLPSDGNGQAGVDAAGRGTEAASMHGDLPPLILRLDALREALAQGRTFEDSAEVIREERESRTTGR